MIIIYFKVGRQSIFCIIISLYFRSYDETASNEVDLHINDKLELLKQQVSNNTSSAHYNT